MTNLLPQIAALPSWGLLLVGGCVLIALASFGVAVYCWISNAFDRRQEYLEHRAETSRIRAERVALKGRPGDM